MRFSIVIPTRERHETLEHALRTCLVQRCEDYEVVVSDNCSGPETRKVVDSFGSDKIKYVRSPRPLAMSDNWELAVSKASGEFVTVMGDDDGLLFHALQCADRLLQELRLKVLRWEWVYYYWPDVRRLPANLLRMPLGRENLILDSRQALLDVSRFRAWHRILPMLYNSFVHRDLIAELRNRTGRVFSDICPDIFSGFAFAYLTPQFASVGTPLGIAGLGARSNGVAHLEAGSSIAREFAALNAAAGLRWKPSIPQLTCDSALAAQAFERAREILFPKDRELRLDRKSLLHSCIADLRYLSEDEFRKAQAALRESTMDDPGLREWLDKELSMWRPLANPREQLAATGLQGDMLVLDAAEFGVNNVYGAAELFEKLFALAAKGLDAKTVSSFRRVRHSTPPLSWLRGALRRGRLAWRILSRGR